MSKFEIEFLETRLEELENAANGLLFMLENEDGPLYRDEFTKSNLTKVLTESAAVRRRLAEIIAEDRHES